MPTGQATLNPPMALRGGTLFRGGVVLVGGSRSAAPLSASSPLASTWGMGFWGVSLGCSAAPRPSRVLNGRRVNREGKMRKLQQVWLESAVCGSLLAVLFLGLQLSSAHGECHMGSYGVLGLPFRQSGCLVSPFSAPCLRRSLTSVHPSIHP